MQLKIKLLIGAVAAVALVVVVVVVMNGHGSHSSTSANSADMTFVNEMIPITKARSRWPKSRRREPNIPN